MAPSYSVSVPCSVVRRVPRRAALLIDAPAPFVRNAILSVDTWTRAATAAGLALSVARRPDPGTVLLPGDVLRIGSARRGCLFRVCPPTSGGPGVITLDGVGATRSHVTVSAVPTPAGSVVTAEVWSGPALRRLRTLQRLQVLLGIVSLVATDADPSAPEGQSDTAPTAGSGESTVVVAGVLVRDGAVLAARRTHPPELGGLWECPGGKVEPGETETDALVRELGEELGIVVRVAERIGPEIAIGHGYRLHAYRVELISGTPSPIVHDALRWVSANEIETLPWLPTDVPLIPHLRRALDAGTRSPEGIAAPS